MYEELGREEHTLVPVECREVLVAPSVRRNLMPMVICVFDATSERRIIDASPYERMRQYTWLIGPHPSADRKNRIANLQLFPSIKRDRQLVRFGHDP